VAGLKDGTLDVAQFNEPAGLASDAGKLYVADTNNHAVRVIDLAAGTVQTLDVRM
jgi:DNA-binding beta-propeller fold protein YncE